MNPTEIEKSLREIAGQRFATLHEKRVILAAADIVNDYGGMLLQLGGIQSCIAEELELDTTPTTDTEVRPILRDLAAKIAKYKSALGVGNQSYAEIAKERDELRATCAELVTDGNAITLAESLQKMEKERDELRAKVASLEEQLGKSSARCAAWAVVAGERADNAELAATAWRKINPDDTATMPPLGQLCWLYDPTVGPFLGSRDDVQGDGWLWGRADSEPCHNGQKWDADVEQDEYHVTHWLPLPSLPNAKVSESP